MDVDNPRERYPRSLAGRCLAEKIIVTGENYSAKCGGTFKEEAIGESARAILIRGQDIDPMPTKCDGDLAWDVLIHVEADSHG